MDMAPPPGVTKQRQEANLGFWKELNELHRGRHPDHEELVARMESYELAFRMQAEMPGVVDLSKESATTLAMSLIWTTGPSEVRNIRLNCISSVRNGEPKVGPT